MIINADYSIITFIPETNYELVQLKAKLNIDLVNGIPTDMYTLPDYSIQGQLYINQPAIITSEGKPAEVLRYNKMVYNLKEGKISNILEITDTVDVGISPDRFRYYGLLQCGAIIGTKRVTSYMGRLDLDNLFLSIYNITTETI